MQGTKMTTLPQLSRSFTVVDSIENTIYCWNKNETNFTLSEWDYFRDAGVKGISSEKLLFFILFVFRIFIYILHKYKII